MKLIKALIVSDVAMTSSSTLSLPTAATTSSRGVGSLQLLPPEAIAELEIGLV
jgi:hypothetical protein